MSKPFHFKKFSIAQDKCAMKVGTDGVLLACWANLNDANLLLDIGTGTGLIAVIACQRNETLLADAIEIDREAADQAAENFSNCPWADRLNVLKGDVKDLPSNSGRRYDHIICNPPFYPASDHSMASGQSRQAARSDTSLSLIELSNSIAALLAADGKASVILPVREAAIFITCMEKNGLFLQRRCSIYPATDKPVHRWLLEFGISHSDEIIKEELVIQQSKRRNDFTADYIRLTRDFYTIL